MALPYADVHASMLAEFGESATLRQQGEADQTVQVIWKRRSFQVDAEGEATVSSSQPVVALQEEGLLRAVSPGDVFVVRGTSWRAVDVLRTGEGWVRCPLHKVAS